MATPAYQISAPEAFSFQSEDWSKWIARFERFRTASGLINKPEAEQNCKFPLSFGDEAIRNRIVCGIRDKRVSEKLQLEADLTLEKANNITRQAEIIKKQQPFVTNHENKM
ncbi:hypothetical protein AVEN_117706-1 [Araneus ventricosus]|uniref:Uncharacterized protein n=1 Tax=Araneus ventricosus TaxID=182803 RepID=A0A4Y2KQC1_ARAVE|nr:hypothetical protein AVEN_117706-1 [Araneus ventricosus]